MSWTSVVAEVIAAAIKAAIEAGKAKRAELKGTAPDLGWRERQAKPRTRTTMDPTWRPTNWPTSTEAVTK